MFDLSYISPLWLLVIMQLFKKDGDFNLRLRRNKLDHRIINLQATQFLMSLLVSVQCISCSLISLTHRVTWCDGCLWINLRHEQLGDVCLSLMNLLGLCSWLTWHDGGYEPAYIVLSVDELINQLWWARHSPSPRNSHQEGTCGWWWGSFCSCWQTKFTIRHWTVQRSCTSQNIDLLFK